MVRKDWLGRKDWLDWMGRVDRNLSVEKKFVWEGRTGW